MKNHQYLEVEKESCVTYPLNICLDIKQRDYFKLLNATLIAFVCVFFIIHPEMAKCWPEWEI